MLVIEKYSPEYFKQLLSFFIRITPILYKGRESFVFLGTEDSKNSFSIHVKNLERDEVVEFIPMRSTCIEEAYFEFRDILNNKIKKEYSEEKSYYTEEEIKQEEEHMKFLESVGVHETEEESKERKIKEDILEKRLNEYLAPFKERYYNSLN